jgi:hypothetical protein
MNKGRCTIWIMCHTKKHVATVESLVNYESDFELKQEEKYKGGENNAD